MAAVLDTIISDCGIATYRGGFWFDIDNWQELIDEAERRHYHVDILRMLRCNIESEARNYICHVQVGTIHAELRAWWNFAHNDRTSYLGVIPRDILTMVSWYLRARLVDSTSIRTLFLGILQSYDDKPALISYDPHRIHMLWADYGCTHRVDKPAEIYIEFPYTPRRSISCYWYQTDNRAPAAGDIFAMDVGLDGVIWCVFNDNLRWVQLDDSMDAAAVAFAHEWKQKMLDMLKQYE